MPEMTLLLHAVIMLICAIELRVSMGNRERMNHLMRDNWRRRQGEQGWLFDAHKGKRGHEDDNDTSK